MSGVSYGRETSAAGKYGDKGMRTLFVNPPSFEKFDAGASARYQATREITSFWYPVWLAYPAGLVGDSRLLDRPAQGVSPAETVLLAKDYEFVVLFTSTAGFKSDIRLAETIKSSNPDIKIAFAGPHVMVKSEDSLKASWAIDFVVRGEFDYAVAEFAEGRMLEAIAGVSYRKDGRIIHNANRPAIQDLDALPFAVDVYKRDLDITRYTIPYLRHPYVSFYTSRGCPALCTFCLWPQTISGHPWRTRSVGNVVAEVQRCRELFPEAKEIFFDDDTFPWAKARTLEICQAFKPLHFTWSCNSRVHTDYETLKAMKEAGCRLLVVGFESGDPTILKHIKKGATVEQALAFMQNCKQLGIVVHGDFQIGLPGETAETVERTIQFAMQLDPETIQVSISHPYPGTEFYDYVKQRGYLTDDEMTDEMGHQLPNIRYPGLDRTSMVQMVERFYDRYYFRPRVIFRILRRAVLDGEERQRLYHEAREFLQLRAKRRAFVRTPPNARTIEQPATGSQA
jgi:hopanoid biosynthesis associated radical SAM protein HpnJ